MTWRRPPHVALVFDGGATGTAYLATLPNGPIMRLDGVGAALVRAVEQGDGTVASISAELAALLELSVNEIDEEAVTDFLAELADQRLLVGR